MEVFKVLSNEFETRPRTLNRDKDKKIRFWVRSPDSGNNMWAVCGNPLSIHGDIACDPEIRKPINSFYYGFLLFLLLGMSYPRT